MPMNANTLAMLIVPSATALFIAYLHRKQMRHNELFRLDPKIGVVPPPSPPVAFIKQHWTNIKQHWTKLLYCVPLLSLVWLYAVHPPMSFMIVLAIAFNVSSVAFMASTNMALSMDLRTLSLIERLANATTVSDSAAMEILRSFNERVKALEAQQPNQDKTTDLPQIAP
jgi:hypothetical protein